MDSGDLLLAGNMPADFRLEASSPTHYHTLNPPARAGDDSSWHMSDWHWDSHAFVAVPKLEQQSLSGCCKRRKTADASAIEVTARPCGGCKAIQHGPLKFLGDNAGSNSCSGSDGKHAFVVSSVDSCSLTQLTRPWQDSLHRPCPTVHAVNLCRCHKVLLQQQPAKLAEHRPQRQPTPLERAHARQMDAPVT